MHVQKLESVSEHSDTGPPPQPLNDEGDNSSDDGSLYRTQMQYLVSEIEENEQANDKTPGGNNSESSDFLNQALQKAHADQQSQLASNKDSEYLSAAQLQHVKTPTP